MWGAFYLGTSLGPLLAGVGVTLIGLPWTMTALSVALLLHCFILGFVACAMGKRCRSPRKAPATKPFRTGQVLLFFGGFFWVGGRRGLGSGLRHGIGGLLGLIS
jgi:hypothetical protein